MLRRFFWSICLLIIFQSVLFRCTSEPTWEDFQGGIHLVLEVESKGDPSIDEENTIRIRDILAERVKQIGIKNMIIKIQGDRRIIIQLPQLRNPERTIDLISRSFVLEFKLVDDEHSLQEGLKGRVPEGDIILYQRWEDQKTGRVRKLPFLLKEKTLMTVEGLKDARVQFDEFKQPYVALKFDHRGAKMFERITAKNVRKRLAIIVDDNIYSAPLILDRISFGYAQITGIFSLDEARDLAIGLKSGAYPVQPRLIELKELHKEIWLGNK